MKGISDTDRIVRIAVTVVVTDQSAITDCPVVAIIVVAIGLCACVIPSAIVVALAGSTKGFGLTLVADRVTLLLGQAVSVFGAPNTSMIAGVAGGEIAGAVVVGDAFVADVLDTNALRIAWTILDRDALDTGTVVTNWVWFPAI